MFSVNAFTASLGLGHRVSPLCGAMAALQPWKLRSSALLGMMLGHDYWYHALAAVRCTEGLG